MNRPKLLLQIIGVMLVALLLAACGAPAATPTPVPPTATPTPVPPTATPTAIPPTATPTPTPVSIPGIDEPIVVEDISVKDPYLGFTVSGDLELQILDAYTEDSLQSGDSAPIYPDDPSDVFLTLMLDLDGPSNCLQWVFRNVTLLYGGEEYQAVRYGLQVGEEGKLAGWLLVFAAPRDSEFGQYGLQLPDGRRIGLAPFLE